GMLDALSLKDTKIGLETLTQMGYPSVDVTLVLNRADTSVGISMNDVFSLLRKAPDVLVPSDRSIPRALTTGMTIFEAEPRSGAGRAFATLARHYAGLTGVAASPAPAADTSTTTGESEPGSGGKRRLLRRSS